MLILVTGLGEKGFVKDKRSGTVSSIILLAADLARLHGYAVQHVRRGSTPLRRHSLSISCSDFQGTYPVHAEPTAVRRCSAAPWQRRIATPRHDFRQATRRPAPPLTPPSPFTSVSRATPWGGGDWLP